ncbi:MAG TPA: CHAT domain-containing protein [Bryobacteraceae bacterium]|nr:CHAT domain-containing protein [Bryobacteraceae bacterium]
MFGLQIPRFRVVVAAGTLLFGLSSVTRSADELKDSGQALSRELSGGSADAVEIASQPGDYVEILIDPRGTLLSLRVDGKVAGTRSGARVYMPMRWCSIVTTAPVRIQVDSQEAPGINRRYGIALVARRSPIATDRERVAACREFHAAEQSLEAGSAGLIPALGHFRSALTHWEAAGDLRPQAEALFQIALASEKLGQAQESLVSYKRSAELYRRLGELSSLAFTLQYLGAHYEVVGDLNHANANYDEALKVSREDHDRIGEANALLNPAFRKAQAKDSAPLDQVLAIYRDEDDRLGRAIVLNLFGVLHFNWGEPETALANLDQALELHRALRNREGEGQVLNNKAAILAQLGEISASRELKQEVLRIREHWGSAADILNTRYNIAVDDLGLGEYDQALDLFEQVRTGSHANANNRAEAFALQGLGNVYRALGAPDQAAPRFEEAVALFRRSKDARGETISETSLGGVQQMQGDSNKARATLSAALQLAKSANLRPEESAAASALGRLHALAGDYVHARTLFEDALTAARASENRRGIVVALEGLGDISRRSDRLDNARHFFSEALTEATAIQSPREQAISGMGLARSEMAAGEIERAGVHARAALRALESERSGLSSPELRASYLSTSGDDYRTTVEILIALDRRKPQAGLAQEAFMISERGRARSLLDMLSAARVQVAPDASENIRREELTTRRRLNDKADRLIRLLAGKHTNAQAQAAEQEVRRAEALYQEAQQRLWRENPRYAELMRGSPATLADVQKALPQGTALIEYSLGEAASVVWTITKSNVQVEHLAPRKRIEQLALAARNALVEPGRSVTGETIAERRGRLQRAGAEFERLSGELSRRILPASLSRLKAKRIWVVSDGALQYLPFAALPLGGTPLVERLEVTYLPSASALQYLGSRVPTPIEKVTVFADPVFSAGDPRVERSTPQRTEPSDLLTLPRLRFSRQEAEEIEAVAGRTTVKVHLDFAANRDNVLNGASAKTNVLHFATHAVVDEKRPDLTAIVLSTVGPDGQPRNGYLRLVDIYHWRINTQLVVLSACQTALGAQLENEGLIGLVRGFFYAGAGDVLATLWNVDDRATAEFIGKFYQALLRDKLPLSTALRRAQNEIRRDARWSNPFYWSAFSLVGA